MIISIVVAMGKNRQIGIENKIPWKISEDLKNFKKITLGHYLLMGRKTFDSIGKPLEGRKNFILTRDLNFQKKDCITVTSFSEAINIATTEGQEELMVIGGAEIYKEALGTAKKIYLSKVEYDGPADAFFPEFDEAQWKVTSEQQFSGPIPWTYRVLEK